MMDHHIDILCIQETRRKISCLQELPNNFLLILSGSDGENDIFSGVGIIVAPHCRRSLITDRQQNERMCMIKLKVKGGKMILFSTYAPPQTIKHPVNERQQFFNELAEFWMLVSCNGPKIIAGDLNSRLYCRLANEHSFIGNSIVE